MPKVSDYETSLQNKFMLDLGKAPFSKTDAKLTKAGACSTCPLRSGCVQSLFPDVKNKQTCTSPKCYAEKLEAHVAREVASGKVPVSRTESYQLRDGKRFDGALPPNKWKEAEKPCKFAVPSIVSDGQGKGRELMVCSVQTCPKHWAKVAKEAKEKKASKPDPEPTCFDDLGYSDSIDAKDSLIAKKLKQSYADAEKTAVPLGPSQMLKIALFLSDALSYQQGHATARAMGWVGTGIPRDFITEKASDMTPDEVQRFMLAVSYMVEADELDEAEVFAEAMEMRKAAKDAPAETDDDAPGNEE
jgi:hypothetical protein